MMNKKPNLGKSEPVDKYPPANSYPFGYTRARASATSGRPTPADLVAQALPEINSPALLTEIGKVARKYPDCFLTEDDQAMIGTMLADWRNNPARVPDVEVPVPSDHSCSTDPMLKLFDAIHAAPAKTITARYGARRGLLAPRFTLLKKILCSEAITLAGAVFQPTKFATEGVRPDCPASNVGVYSSETNGTSAPMSSVKLTRGRVMTIARTRKGAVLFGSMETKNLDGIVVSVKSLGHELNGNLNDLLTNDNLEKLLVGKQNAGRHTAYA